MSVLLRRLMVITLSKDNKTWITQIYIFFSGEKQEFSEEGA